MNYFIYYYIIYYIFRCCRGIYYSRHTSLEQYQVLKSVFPFKDKSIENKMHDISYLGRKIKEKSNKVFLNFIDILWLIAGIVFSTEYIFFTILLIIDVLTRIFPMIMVKKIKSHVQIQNNIKIANILDIIICFFILYNHFINTVIFK